MTQVEFVEIVFRDQYVSRSDMWRLQLSLIGSPIYIQKPIFFSCIRVYNSLTPMMTISAHRRKPVFC